MTTVESGLKIFEKPEFGSVRVVEKDGEPWFVARDVAFALDYPESTLKQVNNLMGHIPDEWRGYNRFMVRSENGVEQAREMLILSDPQPSAALWSTSGHGAGRSRRKYRQPQFCSIGYAHLLG